jgi:hypothetical protein
VLHFVYARTNKGSNTAFPAQGFVSGRRAPLCVATRFGIKREAGMVSWKSASLLLVFLPCARALHLERDANASCGTILLDNSQTGLYNMAFEVSPHHVVKSWQYDFIEEKASREQLLARSCVNMRYMGRFEIPEMLLYGDLSKISIEKTVCVYPNAMTENISIRHIPFFQVAFANVSVHAGTSRTNPLSSPLSLLVSSSFDMNIPWFLRLWQGAIAQYTQQLMAKYTQLLIAKTCLDPRQDAL